MCLFLAYAESSGHVSSIGFRTVKETVKTSLFRATSYDSASPFCFENMFIRVLNFLLRRERGKRKIAERDSTSNQRRVLGRVVDA